MTLVSRALSVSTVAALAVGGAVLLPASASAAGVGDASSAVLYDADGPIGDVATAISDEDDAQTTIALPFALDFFGVEANALCINTNGLVAPVPTLSDDCGSDYDTDLAYYAENEELSVIGALLADNDPGETLWKGPGIRTTEYSVASNILTVTAAAPHGFEVGDTVRFRQSDVGEVERPISAVPTATTFSLDLTGLGYPDEASTPAVGFASLDGNFYTSGENDGFGDTTSIYAGATTVDGKPAFAVTWYRVPTNDWSNEPWLSNTYQIVLVQEPSGGANGSDFTIQFNFGTLMDAADGYEAGDGSDDCDSSEPETCRWSVGLARYDSVTETVEEFEFFADYPVTDIVDGGATPLVANSLNSDVAGRYILGMFDGQVVGFAVPALGAAGAAPALANTGLEPALVLVPVAALVLLVGAGLLIARRRTA